MEVAIKRLGNTLILIEQLKQKIKEYEDAGVPNCANAVNMRNELHQINSDRYRGKYPKYLFFKNEQFNEIVKRNNLVVSTCETYTGNIPDDCFEEIKNENVDVADYDVKVIKGIRVCSDKSNFEIVDTDDINALDAIIKANGSRRNQLRVGSRAECYRGGGDWGD